MDPRALRRRDFLALAAAAAGGLALSPLVPLAAPRGAGRRRTWRYWAPTCETYWNQKQDFSFFRPHKVLSLPGFSGPERSLLTIAADDGSEIRRLIVPGFIHAVLAEGDALFLQTMDQPTLFYAIGMEDLEIRAVARKPEHGHIFGGHMAPIDGGKRLLVTLNAPKQGDFDSVGVYDSSTLREISRFSSFGFQAHDLVTGRRGVVHVGHYGSYFGTGPYQFVKTDVSGSSTVASNALGGSFPGSVCSIDIATGKLAERICAVENGPHGHLRVSRAGEVLLTRNPPWFEARKDSSSHRAFRQGARTAGDEKDFPANAPGQGTSVELDERYRRVLVPQRVKAALLVGGLAEKDRRRRKLDSIDCRKLDAEIRNTHVVQLHPDGMQLIVSTDLGFLALDRATLAPLPKRFVRTKLLDHSHFVIA